MFLHLIEQIFKFSMNMVKIRQMLSQSMPILTLEFSKICLDTLNTSEALSINTEVGMLFLSIDRKMPSEML